MHSDTDDPYGPGFPIRKSQDQSSVTSSPGHIAGSNVLHRLSTPRHPPCALNDLTAPTATRSELDGDKADPSAPPGRGLEATVSSKQDSPQVTWLLKISRSRYSLGGPHLGVGPVSIATSCTSFQRANPVTLSTGLPSRRFPVGQSRRKRIVRSPWVSTPPRGQKAQLRAGFCVLSTAGRFRGRKSPVSRFDDSLARASNAKHPLQMLETPVSVVANVPVRPLTDATRLDPWSTAFRSALEPVGQTSLPPPAGGMIIAHRDRNTAARCGAAVSKCCIDCGSP